ncbi:hypothetical protein AB0N17_31250 [Streptomyces sp. NPDC051133]|uniref:hypothetical protein n=1 Tax=Streptomyces sp. NPDC051133 TaxID=3155521 RepID=UPI00341ECE68
MGERHSGEGLPCRPHAHPGGTAAASGSAPVSAPDRTGTDAGGTPMTGLAGLAALEAGFAAALRADGVDPDAERRALAAFRTAREAGAHRVRTRSRDDWRPAAPRRGRRSPKVTLSMALACLTLGGVAVAAIGSVGSGTDGRRDTPHPRHPSPSAPQRPAGGPGTTVGGPSEGASRTPAAHPAHPDTARDTAAHCRTFARAGERGGALDSAAWQRLVAAAGGPDGVASYCAAQVDAAQGQNIARSGKSGKSGNSGESGSDATGNGEGKSDTSGSSAAKSKQGGGKN